MRIPVSLFHSFNTRSFHKAQQHRIFVCGPVCDEPCPRNHDCSYKCLRSPVGPICICQLGQAVTNDTKTCKMRPPAVSGKLCYSCFCMQFLFECGQTWANVICIRWKFNGDWIRARVCRGSITRTKHHCFVEVPTGTGRTVNFGQILERTVVIKYLRARRFELKGKLRDLNEQPNKLTSSQRNLGKFRFSSFARNP